MYLFHPMFYQISVYQYILTGINNITVINKNASKI